MYSIVQYDIVQYCIVQYDMLGDFALYLLKKVHDSIKTKPYSFEMASRLFVIKTLFRIQLHAEVKCMKNMEFFSWC